jgi:hypothetical protein
MKHLEMKFLGYGNYSEFFSSATVVSVGLNIQTMFGSDGSAIS